MDAAVASYSLSLKETIMGRIKRTATDWSSWEDAGGSMVTDVRYSSCGRWIEKRYSSEEAAKATMQAQQYEDVLIAMPGTEPCSYISEKVDVINHDLANILFDRLNIETHWDLVEEYDQDEKESFLADVKRNSKGIDYSVKEAGRIWDYSWKSQGLDFDDMHWLNYGFHESGSFICIDYDCANYYCEGVEYEEA